MATRIKRQIKNPRLLKIRKELIEHSIIKYGIFSYEVAEIFRITEQMVSQIRNKGRKK